MRKVEVKESSQERRILAAMIVNDKVLQRVAAKWGDGELFRSSWANMIGGWCIRHFKKYEASPQKGIIAAFETWVAKGKKSPETVENIQTFLANLDYDHDLNIQHCIDEATEYFHSVKLSRLANTIQDGLERGSIEDCDNAILTHSKVELGGSHGVDLFIDREAVRAALDVDILEPLVRYRDGLGKFFYNHLSRDSFVVFAAPQKGAKTYWLADVAWEAMVQRKRTAFFEVGDLTDRQIDRRFLERASQRPSRSIDGRWPYEVKIPTKIDFPSDRKGKVAARIAHRNRVFKRGLNFPLAWKACEEVMRDKVKSTKSYFRRSFHPNLSISILGIKSIVDSWILDGWTPDVVVIDYADNLAPVDKKEETRDRVNTTWKYMRAFSQQLRCLLVTATQVKASGFTTWCLDRRHFSEDNRKLSHCTAMFGINTTPAEKEKGLCRLNCIVGREGENSVHRFCYVGGCLAISNPSMVSIY